MHHHFKFKTYYLCHNDVYEKETEMKIPVSEFSHNTINDLKAQVFAAVPGTFYIEHEHQGVVR